MKIHVYLLITLGILLSILDSLLPLPVHIVGAKIGLANLTTLFAFIYLDEKDAIFILLARIFIYAIFFGGPFVFLYSLAGGIISFLFMLLLKKMHCNIILISAVGGFFHPVGQLLMASIVLKNTIVFSYLLPLGIIGILAGILLGVIAKRVNIKIGRKDAF